MFKFLKSLVTGVSPTKEEDNRKRDEAIWLMTNKLKYLWYTPEQIRILQNINDLIDAWAVDETLEQVRAMVQHMYHNAPLPAVKIVPHSRRPAQTSGGGYGCDPFMAFYLIDRELRR